MDFTEHILQCRKDWYLDKKGSWAAALALTQQLHTEGKAEYVSTAGFGSQT